MEPVGGGGTVGGAGTLRPGTVLTGAGTAVTIAWAVVCTPSPCTQIQRDRSARGEQIGPSRGWIVVALLSRGEKCVPAAEDHKAEGEGPRAAGAIDADQRGQQHGTGGQDKQNSRPRFAGCAQAHRDQGDPHDG